jgi:DNA-binding response OmpR family regulator
MNKKILIVEDEPGLLKVLVDKFAKEGYEVVFAKDGQEGLDSAINNHPDLILLDIVMPVMDGMTMLNKLREDQWGKDANVILLTNLTEASKVNESYTQGVNDYLIKCDWTLEQLVEKIKAKFSVN